jgi:hypothetical protein
MQILKMPMSESAPEVPKPQGFFARLRRSRAAADAAWLEEARQRMRSRPGFIESLPPEVLEKLKTMEEPAASGGPAPKRPGL